MEFSPEDSLRLNVLLAGNVQAIRIDEQALTLHGLTERGTATIALHPSGRKEAYLRQVREVLSEFVLGASGGFQVFLRQWTRHGQPLDKLDKLLLLGEPEAVVSVAYSAHITSELARRAWWAMPEADNARRMLERACVADAPIGRELADFLIENLPFERDPHVMMDSVRIVLHPGLLDDSTRMRLWGMASRNNAYYVPFLERSPDDLPGASAARADWQMREDSLAPLIEKANPYAVTLARALSASGQVFLRACEEVLLHPANRDVVIGVLNALGAYFSAVRFAAENERAGDIAAQEILATLPALDGALRAMQALARVDAGIIRPTLAHTTAEGTLMRKKLEPVIVPLLRQLAVLRGKDGIAGAEVFSNTEMSLNECC